MQFIDTHIHLQDYKSINATDIIAQALNAGVQKLVCVSIQEKDWALIAQIYEQFPQIIVPAFGIHPWYVNTVQEGWQNRLRLYLEQIPCALVGECGLDRLKNPQEQPQNQVFAEHLQIARDLQRPVIIHAVKCQDWLLPYWKQLPVKFVFHSYNGKSELLKQIIKQGGYVGVSASILKNRDVSALINLIPKDRLLFETDGPYQSLYPQSEAYPWFIAEQAEKLALLSQQNTETLAAQVYQNSLEFIKC